MATCYLDRKSDVPHEPGNVNTAKKASIRPVFGYTPWNIRKQGGHLEHQHPVLFPFFLNSYIYTLAFWPHVGLLSAATGRRKIEAILHAWVWGIEQKIYLFIYLYFLPIHHCCVWQIFSEDFWAVKLNHWSMDKHNLWYTVRGLVRYWVINMSERIITVCNDMIWEREKITPQKMHRKKRREEKRREKLSQLLGEWHNVSHTAPRFNYGLQLFTQIPITLWNNASLRLIKTFGRSLNKEAHGLEREQL